MTLVDAETGEIVRNLPAIPEPTALVQSPEAMCSSIEAWADGAVSVDALNDVKARLAAIDTYLARTSTAGRKRVSATLRRLEVRIGQLLGPARAGNPTGANQHGGTSRANEVPDSGLTPNQRSEFRSMAEHPDAVEEVIEQSTDDDPPSRRKVIDAIKTTEPKPASTKPRRSPLPDAAGTAGWALRKAVERIQRICDDDRLPANKQEVAGRLHGHLSYTVEVCQDLLDLLGPAKEDQ